MSGQSDWILQRVIDRDKRSRNSAVSFLRGRKCEKTDFPPPGSCDIVFPISAHARQLNRQTGPPRTREPNARSREACVTCENSQNRIPVAKCVGWCKMSQVRNRQLQQSHSRMLSPSAKLNVVAINDNSLPIPIGAENLQHSTSVMVHREHSTCYSSSVQRVRSRVRMHALHVE